MLRKNNIRILAVNHWSSRSLPHPRTCLIHVFISHFLSCFSSSIDISDNVNIVVSTSAVAGNHTAFLAMYNTTLFHQQFYLHTCLFYLVGKKPTVSGSRMILGTLAFGSWDVLGMFVLVVPWVFLKCLFMVFKTFWEIFSLVPDAFTFRFMIFKRCYLSRAILSFIYRSKELKVKTQHWQLGSAGI